MHAIAEHTSWASGDGHTTSVSLYYIRMKHVVLGKLELLWEPSVKEKVALRSIPLTDRLVKKHYSIY